MELASMFNQCLTNVLPVSKHVAWCWNFWRKALVFPQVFKPRTPPEAIALCSRLLEYTPASRLSPLEACAHAFFDELRQPNTRLPSGRELPMLFNFSTTGSRVKVLFPSLFSLLIDQLSCSCSAWWLYVCNHDFKVSLFCDCWGGPVNSVCLSFVLLNDTALSLWLSAK